MLKKIGVFLLLAIAISLLLIDINQDQFSSERWRDNPLERYRMVDDLLENSLLKKKSKEAVIQLLGYPDVEYEGDVEHLAYMVGEAPSFFEQKPNGLLIIFENQVVIKVTLIETERP
jgi:hypothetical protein